MGRVPQILTRLRQSLKFEMAAANGAQKIVVKDRHDCACASGYRALSLQNRDPDGRLLRQLKFQC
jgi:hypothetical protein